MSAKNTIVGFLVDALLTRQSQEKLGRFIYRRSRGEGDDRPEHNGEYRLLRALATRVSPGPVLFDVGANKGDWVIQFKRAHRGPIRAFAFEPAADTFAYLSRRLGELRLAPEICAVNAALADRDGEAPFYLTGSLSGSNSLFERPGLPVVDTRKVSLQTGDTFCRERGVDRIDFVKIDTEGGEWQVLRGFEAMLRDHRIKALQFEYGGAWIDARILLKDVFQLLGDRGYRLGRIMPDGIIFSDQYCRELENFAYSNWVAVIRGQEAFVE